ncbi:hypothetical protein KL918_001326 [Ogataea parapolymorpha]|uniref:TBC1 domain family member 20 n=1 Tax=Ogataea parapolymorpha (strain ATCC 26012 / BCRC 20466 / JCM 22074 / NRRL Y-7560 / DL-1) TaxID=871575 RepID=W1QE50_OGAPD|nr:TBC1 domain family member 20 [Ogataea parapolymorpha DL-1]ESW99738.1 TBC1 domain family member 20 [Ogataea parapolymorpha DL-1]KAG7868683.1 hypothetical protein KL918_001326 [Ogataea parapolymorpha]KAG7874535.1 hypothetical protein KL916_001301 [Ogataea parapolymorpha]
MSVPEWTHMECDCSIFNEYPMTTENESLKLKSLHKVLESQDTAPLRYLVTTRSGAVNREQRTIIWPKLLELDSWNPPPPVPHLKHKDHEQITKDIERSFVFYPKTSPDEMLRLRQRLDNLINNTLCAYPGLNYYQGYHDVASIAVLIFDDFMAYKFMTKLTLMYLRDHMLPDIESTVRELKLIPELLSLVDPKLHALIGSIEPVYALSSMISLFAHDIADFNGLCLVWDFILAQNSAVSAYYIYVAVLVFYKDDILNDLDDLLGKSFTSDDTLTEETELNLSDRDLIHVTLNNWISHNLKCSHLFEILKNAMRYMSDFPHESLQSTKGLSRYSMLRASSLDPELILLHTSEQKRYLKRSRVSKALVSHHKTLSLVIKCSIGIGVAGLVLKYSLGSSGFRPRHLGVFNAASRCISSAQGFFETVFNGFAE